MARNKRAEARKRKKARKRAERERRQTQTPTGTLPTFREMRQAAGRAMDSLVDEDGWFDEPDDDEEECSLEVAEYFASASDEVAGALAMHAEDAARALAEWPDDARTAELRTALLELVGAADRDAERWRSIRARFATLRAGATRHVHLLDGKLITSPSRKEEDRTADEIPY
jgi:hypothetical protein